MIAPASPSSAWSGRQFVRRADLAKLFIGEVLPNTDHDLLDAKSIAALICGRRRRSALTSSSPDAKPALLADHADIVQRLADVLVERCTLDGREIDTLIRGEDVPIGGFEVCGGN
jgi:hypothetical protein